MSPAQPAGLSCVEDGRPDGQAWFVLAAPITRADIPQLCEQLADRLEANGGAAVVCDVAALDRPDVVAVDALARLSLLARRGGSHLLLCGVNDDLRVLVALAGLTETLPECLSPVEVCRQPEHREEARVQEVRDLRDPTL